MALAAHAISRTLRNTAQTLRNAAARLSALGNTREATLANQDAAKYDAWADAMDASAAFPDPPSDDVINKLTKCCNDLQSDIDRSADANTVLTDLGKVKQALPPKG